MILFKTTKEQSSDLKFREKENKKYDKSKRDRHNKDKDTTRSNFTRKHRAIPTQ